MNRVPTSARVLSLEPNAGALLDLLVDLGHLDDRLLELVNDRLLDLEAGGGVVSYDDARRVVAEIIFEQSATMDTDYQRMIEAEWSFLFH